MDTSSAISVIRDPEWIQILFSELMCFFRLSVAELKRKKSKSRWPDVVSSFRVFITHHVRIEEGGSVKFCMRLLIVPSTVQPSTIVQARWPFWNKKIFWNFLRTAIPTGRQYEQFTWQITQTVDSWALFELNFGNNFLECSCKGIEERIRKISFELLLIPEVWICLLKPISASTTERKLGLLFRVFRPLKRNAWTRHNFFLSRS